MYDLRLASFGPTLVDLADGMRMLADAARAAAGHLDEVATGFVTADGGVLVADARAHAVLAAAASSATDALGVIAPLLVRGRHYLWADPSGDGRVVEVLGDLRGAEHVAVFVPGMTNELRGYPGAARARAASLLAAMRTEAPGRRVAVIAWLGYDTPDGSPSGLLEAAGSGTAAAAVPDLARDLGVVHALAPQAHVTLVGHSYGSVVAARTVRDGGVAVDDLVVVGSPGLDVGSVRGLHAPATRVWAGRPDPRFLPSLAGGVTALATGGLFAPLGWGLAATYGRLRRADPVADAPVHGPDPASPRFGARHLPVPDARGHSSYFAPGSRSVRNLARVAVRRADLLTV